ECEPNFVKNARWDLGAPASLPASRPEGIRPAGMPALPGLVHEETSFPNHLGHPDTPKSALPWIGQLLAIDAIEPQRPIVAQELERFRVSRIHNDRFRIETLEMDAIDFSRQRISARPEVKMRVADAIGGAGDEDVLVLPIAEVANALTAQVEQDGIAKP